jgi:hypothetical protein
VHELKTRGVALKATEQPVDTALQRAKRFSICSAYSPNLKPTCAVSGSSRDQHRQSARRLGIGRASVYRLVEKEASVVKPNGGGDAD